MKSLNENWFAFTLVAIVFGLLGFLLGRQGGYNKCQIMGHASWYAYLKNAGYEKRGKCVYV